MKRYRATLPPVLLTALLLLAACGRGEPAAPEGASGGDEVPAFRGAGVEVEVTLAGMHCQGCEIEIENAVQALDGVEKARADHESGLVRVWIRDPDAREALIAAVRDAVHTTEYKIVGEDEIPDTD